MTHEEYKQQLTAWAGLTEKRLAALCDEYLPQQSELGQAARYSLLGGGKRVRAVLTLSLIHICALQAAPGILHMALRGLPDSGPRNGKLLPAAV